MRFGAGHAIITAREAVPPATRKRLELLVGKYFGSKRRREHTMAMLVVGSVAFDTLKTPYGVREKILGGAATYFSLSASYFTKVRVVAVVGEDFPPNTKTL